MQLSRLMLRSTAIASLFYTVTAIIPCNYLSQPLQAQESAIVGTKDNPLTLSLGSLDGSWRKFKIAGQYELGDLMQQWVSFLGTSSYSNSYLTQGKTIRMAGKTYLVAYRLPVGTTSTSFQDMFSSWSGATSTQCADLTAMENNVLNMESKVTLSLLNFDTIGSLNEIQPFDLTAEIQASQANFEAMKTSCQEAQAQAAIAEAREYVNLINSGQQATFLETNKFATSIEALQYGIPKETDNYTYSLTTQTANFSAVQAIAKSETGVSVVGATAAMTYPGEDYPTTISIMCKSSEAGQLPNPPIFDANARSLTCAPGTEELSWY